MSSVRVGRSTKETRRARRLAGLGLATLCACGRSQATKPPPPRPLDVCAGDDALSKLQSWQSGAPVWGPRDGWLDGGAGPGPAPRGGIRWSRDQPRTDDLRIDDLVSDAQGRTVLVGTLAAPVTVEGVKLVPALPGEPFVLRLDPQGRAVGGAVVAGLPHGDARLLVAACVGEDVVIAGPSMASPGWSAEQSPDGLPFIARVGPDGTVRWNRPLGVRRVMGIGAGPDGSVALSGRLRERAGTETSVVTRWSPDGSQAWQKILGDPATRDFHWPAFAWGVAVDAENAIVVAGTIETNEAGHVDFGQGAVDPRGERGFVAKFAADGRVLWSRGIAYGWPYAVAVGGDTIVMGGEATCGSDRKEAFALAMDGKTGTDRWAWGLPHPQQWIGRVAAASDGTATFIQWGGDDGEEVVGSIERSGAVAWSRRIYAWANGPPLPPKLASSPAGPVVVTARTHPVQETGRVIALVK